MTLSENILIIQHTRERDKEMWNHTASLMALYANSKSGKGKRYSPDEFNPHSLMKKEMAKPKTREDIDKLINKYKSFNG